MTGQELNLKPHEQAVMLGEDLTRWQARMDGFMAQGAHIIAIRGAGTVNGIEPDAAEAATAMLYDQVTTLSAEGRPVVLMFDGDEDNREKPDVGAVFGTLVDSLKDDPNVTAICAQTKSWYYPEDEGGALTTFYGNPYETYVFDDSVPGGHAALTQSKSLVSYPGYEQVFVGAAGKIAYNQLSDLSQKASDHPVKVTVLKAPLNPDPAIDEKLAVQLQNASAERKTDIQSKIDQRAGLPYGALFTKDGDLTDQVTALPGITLKTLPVDPDKVSKGVEVLYPNKLRKKMDQELQQGTPASLETLLDKGVSVDQEDWEGRTPLMLYASKGDVDTVRMLVQRGANINYVYMYQGRLPFTALDAARHTGNADLVDMLVALGAKSGNELR